MQTIKRYASLVRFEHTLFALPFALTGFVMGVKSGHSGLSLKLLFLVVLCMVFARNSAMAFNRWLDRHFDKLNPRTAQREIPSGIVSPKSAIVFVLVNSVLFIVAAWFINSLCFFLSPVALFVILFYSYTKRFTPLCHFVLSLGLAIAPVGAYLAVTGQFHWQPVVLGAIVFFWASGFDIIYALQDMEVDLGMNLKSIPALLGKGRALRLSGLLHLTAVAMVVVLVIVSKGSWLHITGSALFAALLFYQHTLVKPDDLSRVNLAFFTSNGIASVLYAIFMIGDMLLL